MKNWIYILILGLSFTILSFKYFKYETQQNQILSTIIDLKSTDLRLFLKDKSGINYKNIGNLKKKLDSLNIELVFAMNAGMFNSDLSPKGLYIEENQIVSKIDTIVYDYGNFYLQPNGVFFITNDKHGFICNTRDFILNSNIKYATQSGPMLLINSKINSNFNKNSTNLNIRNGVGILKDGRIVFAISNCKINFFDFASYFKQIGCLNALYLDGFISKIYLPKKNIIQLDGKFGVIIGEINMRCKNK